MRDTPDTLTAFASDDGTTAPLAPATGGEVIGGFGVRDATEDDLPAMLAMGRRFIEQAWSRIGIWYCEESCIGLLRGLMGSDNGILLVAPDRTGMIGLIVHAWPFNQHVMTATELFWWSEGKFGAALRRGAEARLRALGIPTLNMACQDHMRSPALERLYRMDGFAPSEHIFIKALH